MTENSAKRVAELREVVSKNPGADEFAELSELLSEDDGTRPEAREICFRGLNHNPKNARARLALARSFYLDGYAEFCVRELIELSRQVDSPALGRLIDAFGDYAKPFRSAQSSGAAVEQSEEDDILAELDLDEDFVEVLDELEEEDSK